MTMTSPGSVRPFPSSPQFLPLIPLTCLEDDSPYPEVRSAVANYDDQAMPVNTLRAWLLGMLWAVILPAINEFYYFRYPSLMVTNVRPTSHPPCIFNVSSTMHRAATMPYDARHQPPQNEANYARRSSRSSSPFPSEGPGHAGCPTTSSSVLPSILASSLSRNTYEASITCASITCGRTSGMTIIVSFRLAGADYHYGRCRRAGGIRGM